MKMEKTDLEFVEFDAKDVITTSWAGFGMYAKQDILEEYNEHNKNLFKTGATAAGLGYNPDAIFETTPVPADVMFGGYYDKESKEYVIHKAMSQDYYTVEGVTYRQAREVQDIVDWLAANHIQ